MKVFLYGCVETNKLTFGNLFHFTMDLEDQYSENVNVCVSEIIRVIDTVRLQYMVRVDSAWKKLVLVIVKAFLVLQ